MKVGANVDWIQSILAANEPGQVDLVQAIVLGVVQGLTEFLPISSSGHLILVPWVLGWQEPGKVFDVALHAGTLAALLVYYWRTWLDLLLHDQRRLALLILGSIPAGIVGLVFQDFIDENFGKPEQIALGLIVFGLLLYVVDRTSSQKRDFESFTWRDALIVGSAQAIALFPGVSRSGITITTGLLLGFRRDVAATYSFLLATPITGGAVLWAGYKLMKTGVPADERLPFLVGVLVSGLVGALAITVLIRYVRHRSYAPFVAYRLIVGGATLVLGMLRR